MKKILLLSDSLDYKSGISDRIRWFYANLMEQALKKNLQIIRSSIYEYNIKEKKFHYGESFENGEWKQMKDIVPDIVWYKSNKVGYLTRLIEENFQFINNTKLIALANDKYMTSIKFKESSPLSMPIDKINKDNINNFKSKKLIIKPIGWSGGKWVKLLDKKNILDSKERNLTWSYLVQEFIDLSWGIKWLIDGIHDIRFVVFGKEIRFCVIRYPAKGDFRCNISSGWWALYPNLADIPKELLDIVKNINNNLLEEFHNCYVSIDFGKGIDEKYYLIEINTSTGIDLWVADKKQEKKYFSFIIDMFYKLTH